MIKPHCRILYSHEKGNGFYEPLWNDVEKVKNTNKNNEITEVSVACCHSDNIFAHIFIK